MRAHYSDYLIAGAGVAGLFCALKASSHGTVSILTRDTILNSNTALAQGGIAAALEPGDSPLMHLRDTLAAGAGACDARAVGVLVNEGVERVQELAALGMPFDQKPGGGFKVTREGAHSLARVIPALGDATGLAMAQTLQTALAKEELVRIHQGRRALELLLDQGRCVGVLAVKASGEPMVHLARAVVLATGGLGRLYKRTTASRWCNGAGLAMAYRAGARLRDLEYVQFHPTALACGEDPLPLVSEAVRGHGAVLLDQNGCRFMTYRHPMAELAPRDVVARAIFEYEQQGQRVYLDATSMGDGFAERFPSIHKSCQERGLEPGRQVLPVTPAAHFLMGGVQSGLDGTSSLPGLFVCGEAACTGVHGANRLASNSLLEGLVFGHRTAQALAGSPQIPASLRMRDNLNEAQVQAMIPQGRSLEECLPSPHDSQETQALLDRLRQVMWSQVGLVRRADGLIRALDTISQIESQAPAGALELADMLSVARLTAQAALARRESKGSHFREDYPPPQAATSGQYLCQGALS